MDQAARGKKALESKDYDAAIVEFTAALKIAPTSPDYLTQRSTAYHRKQEFTKALADAEQAVLNAQKRAKRELILGAQFRRAQALYGMERFGDALFVYNVVLGMKKDHKESPMWIQKTKMALEKLPEDDERRNVTVTETPEGESTVDDAASPGASKTSEEPASSAKMPNTSQQPTVPAAPAAPQQTPADKIRHEWYQNTENIYFTLLAKGVPKDKAQVDIQERSLDISFPLVNGSSYGLTLEPLFAAVNPGKCITRVMSTKVEVILVKATPGQKWSALEGSHAATMTSSEPVTTDATESDDVKRAFFSAQPAGPAYPTSSKSGPKDWDKITSSQLKSSDSDGKTSIEDDDDYEGGDEANHFFKKLFKGATPEAQRAMMKSYTESNGTALSTDWADVSKKTVETVPPEGMTAKKWGE